MKLLSFEVKLNLKKAPRIHVRSSACNQIYGSFPANEPDKFEGRNKMNLQENNELNLYTSNLNAIKEHLGLNFLNELTDYRLRLPASLIDIIDKTNMICAQESVELDIYPSIIKSIVEALKAAVANLDGKNREEAINLLQKVGLEN